MRSPAHWFLFGLIASSSAVSLVACKSRGAGGGSAGSQPISSAVASAKAPAAETPSPRRVELPEGPVLAIQAGKGVGPIRLGATATTIERLMEAPCDVKTADVCRYIRRAVEFHLDKDGATDRIVVHRRDRPAGTDAQGKAQVYGFFNGGIPPGVGLGMIPKAVIEILGPPLRSQRVTETNVFSTIDRDTYPGGMELEYDEYTNGKVMLGAVIITKEKK